MFHGQNGWKKILLRNSLACVTIHWPGIGGVADEEKEIVREGWRREESETREGDRYRSTSGVLTLQPVDPVGSKRNKQPWSLFLIVAIESRLLQRCSRLFAIVGSNGYMDECLSSRSFARVMSSTSAPTIAGSAAVECIIWNACIYTNSKWRGSPRSFDLLSS